MNRTLSDSVFDHQNFMVQSECFIFQTHVRMFNYGTVASSILTSCKDASKCIAPKHEHLRPQHRADPASKMSQTSRIAGTSTHIFAKPITFIVLINQARFRMSNPDQNKGADEQQELEKVCRSHRSKLGSCRGMVMRTPPFSGKASHRACKNQ